MFKKVEALSTRTIVMMFSTVLLNALSIITAPIFTRILTTGDYGNYSLYLSWVSILSIISGIQTYGTLNNAKIDFDSTEYKNYCANIFLLSMLGWLVVAIVIWGGYSYIYGMIKLPEKCIFWLLVGSFGLYSVNFLNNYLLIEKKVVQNLLVSIILALSTTIGSIILIMGSSLEGYFARILIHGNVYLIVGVITTFYFFSAVKFKIKWSYWKYCLQLSLPLVLHSLSGILLAQSDRIMLMSFRGNDVVGVYSFCYTLAIPISAIVGAINSSWKPEYYTLMRNGKNEEIEKHYKRQIFLVTGLCCGYMMVSPEVLKILSVEEYWVGRTIIPLVVISYFFNFIYFFPANYEFYNKKTKYIAGSTMGAALGNIILNYILIPEYGMQGAAVATIISYIFLFLIHDFIAKKIIKGYAVSKTLYLKGIIPLVVCWIISEAWMSNMLARWLIGVVIGAVIIIRIIKQKTLI